MNKLLVFIVLLALASLQINAKKAKKHEAQKEETKQSEEETKQSDEKIEQPEDEDEPEIKGFFPGFAIRIPVPNFGILSNIRERLDDLFTGNKPVGLSDFVPSSDKSGKFKTTTKVKNSTRGPFKTYSISSQTVSTDNKSSPHVVSQVFKSLTTLDKTKLPKGKDGKVQIPSMQFELGPFASPLLDTSEEEKCKSSSDCKSGKYCDAFFSVCKKLSDPGASCTQKNQCDSKNGKYRCTWGRCIANSEQGSLGTFCDADTECHSNDEELSCQQQTDITRFSGVCMARLDEGATCGNAIRSMFDMAPGLFKRDEDSSDVCKKGLACRTVGFFGRKVCLKDSPEFASTDEPQPEQSETFTEKKTKTQDKKKNDKNKKLKFKTN